MFKAWKWGTYIFFAVFLAAGIVWVWFCLPETKGISLEEMDLAFNSRSGEADAILLYEARRDVGLYPSSDDSATSGASAKDQLKEKDETHMEEV